MQILSILVQYTFFEVRPSKEPETEEQLLWRLHGLPNRYIFVVYNLGVFYFMTFLRLKEKKKQVYYQYCLSLTVALLQEVVELVKLPLHMNRTENAKQVTWLYYWILFIPC